ncbi:MAG: hypothetical protein ABH863_05945 [Candidatus Micrarchaeota archaeon]
MPNPHLFSREGPRDTLTATVREMDIRERLTRRRMDDGLLNIMRRAHREGIDPRKLKEGERTHFKTLVKWGLISRKPGSKEHHEIPTNRGKLVRAALEAQQLIRKQEQGDAKMGFLKKK